MKKRIISMLLVFVMMLGLLPTMALAASSEEETLGEVDICNEGTKLSYLSINGRVRRYSASTMIPSAASSFIKSTATLVRESTV